MLRSTLEMRLEATIREAMHEQVGQFLVDHTELEIPEGVSQRQTDRSIARRKIAMYQAGVPETEIDKRTDELRAKAREQTVRDLKLFFILEKIAEERDIKVTEEQINGAIAHIAQRSGKRFDRVRDELSKGDGLTTLYLQLRDEQVLQGLLDGAEITETEGPKKKKPATKAKKKTTAKKTAKKATGKKTGKEST
jgi:trigger factor